MIGKAFLMLGVALVALGVSPPNGVAAASYETGDEVYSALQPGPSTRLSVGGGQIDVVFADGGTELDRTAVLDWIRRSAEAVSVYFGRFPVRHVGLLIVPTDGATIRGGTTFGYSGSAIRIHVGRGAGAGAFAADWILVHEMTHLALPDLPRRSLWLQEGEATYVEPIARAQAGQVDPTVVWRWAVKGMPSGQARASAGGLDGTRDHDRIYWGGATFWLLADIAIRRRTDGAYSVQDALRAINRASGGNTTEWSPSRMLAAGDAATGGSELRNLYARMKDAPHPLDISALLASLGVREGVAGLTLDDRAPLADLRRRITAPPGHAR